MAAAGNGGHPAPGQGAGGIHGQQRGPQANGPPPPPLGHMNNSIPQGNLNGGMHSAPQPPATSAPPTHERNGPYGAPPPHNQIPQYPHGRVPSIHGNPPKSKGFGEPRLRQKVEVFDVNDECRTEADAREFWASYHVIQIVKADTTNDCDDEGYQKLPTWDKARHSVQSNVSKQEATRRVRELEREGPPVLEKKENLPPALQQQLDHAQDVLEDEETDPRFQYILAQLYEKKKKVDAQMIATHRDMEYSKKHKHRGGSRDSHKHSKHKKSKSKSKNRNKYHNLAYFMESYHPRHKPKRERVSVTAFFKRVLRPEESGLSMLQEHEGGYENARFVQRPAMPYTNTHSLPPMRQNEMYPDQHRMPFPPNGQHMAPVPHVNQGFPPPNQAGPGQHHQQGHPVPQGHNQNFQGPHAQQIPAQNGQHANPMMPPHPPHQNMAQAGPGHSNAPQNNQPRPAAGPGPMRGPQPNGQPPMNQGVPRQNAPLPQQGQPNGQGPMNQGGKIPPPSPHAMPPRPGSRAQSRNGRHKPYVEPSGKKPKVYPDSPRSSEASLTDDEYSGSESSGPATMSSYSSDSDRGRRHSRSSNKKRTRPEHHGILRRHHGRTSTQSPKVIVAPSPLRRSFGEVPVMETMWNEPWTEEEALPLRRYGRPEMPPRIVQGVRRIPALEPRIEAYEELDHLPEFVEQMQIGNSLRTRPSTGYPRDDLYDRQYVRGARAYSRDADYEGRDDWTRRPLSRQFSDADAREYMRLNKHAADIELDNPFRATRRRQTYDSGGYYGY